MRKIGAVFFVVVCFLTVTYAFEVRAEQTSDYAVQVSATVSKSPPTITLIWPAPTVTPGQYRIFRKAKTDGTFGGPIATIGGNSTSYTDNNISVGIGYEYAIDTNGSYGFGYIYAGIEVPMIDSRGKIIFIVDNSQGPSMSNELNALQQDWIGDGWTVIRHDVGRNDSVVSVKNLITNDYNADPGNVKAVMLFGHVPVPYSGDLNPDGHAQHKGAWPADCYYGVMSGAWTDNSVNDTGASARDTTLGDNPQANWNRPGDGKFDQTNIPGQVALQVGRVDLGGLPQFAPLTETDLLRNYLNKDHKFRNGQISVQRRGLVDDNFGTFGGEAFAGNGWRNFAPMFGAQNITVINSADQNANANAWTNTLQSNSYLWCCGCGPGYWYISQGVSKVDMFAQNDPQGVFYMLFGSFFGDFDSMQNYLRAPLGSRTSGLACAWVGRPNWYFHHMVLGDTIGYSAALTQNNSGLYRTNTAGNQVHIALMGDPTLRMHPVQPPSNLAGSGPSGNVALTWNGSSDSNIAGYHVYRSNSSSGPFTRLTAGVVSGNSYNDNGVAQGAYTYMVRAVKLESTGSGTYFNPSQGIFTTINVGSGGNQPPVITSPASANPNPATVGQQVSFSVGATSSSGYSLTYQWSYGDGTSDFNATHAYTTAGSYQATVSVTDGHGGSATSSVTVTVNSASGNPPPVFTAPLKAWPSNPAIGQQVLFTVSASDPDGDAVTISYNYGDGSPTGNTEKHTYSTAGTYTAMATANDGHGGTAASSTVVTVGGGGGGSVVTISAPASANPNPATVGQQVVFKVGATSSGGYALTYQWNYGDGTSNVNAAHAYTNAGTFSATVTITDGHGGSATSSISVTVNNSSGNRPPVFTAPLNAWPSNPAVGQQVLFTLSASDPDGDALTISYNYGDGSPMGSTEKHSYGTAGTYTIVATANDGHGGTATSSTVVVVGGGGGGSSILIKAPLQAWPNPVQPGQPVLFTIGVSDPNSWTIIWTYGDNTSGNTERHVYATAGSFVATAKVTDSKGASASSSVVVVVSQAVIGRSSSQLGVSGLSVKLNYLRKGDDTIVLSGVLPVTKGFKGAGSVLALDVGGVSKTFMLSANATGKNGRDSSRIRLKKDKTGVSAQQAPFSITFKSGNFTALAASGLTNANHNGDHASLPIMLVFDNTLYETTVPVSVSGVADRSLLARK